MTRLTREESQARTRARLLECAPRVVARDGFEGASVDKIAEAAGFSKGAFYSNFASKEEFFLELLERNAGQDVTEIGRLLDGVRDPADVVDRICDWANDRAADPTWGLLALELFRRARRDATFGQRHATLFREQWRGVGEMLLVLAPDWPSPEPELVGAMVLEPYLWRGVELQSGPWPRSRRPDPVGADVAPPRLFGPRFPQAAPIAGAARYPRRVPVDRAKPLDPELGDASRDPIRPDLERIRSQLAVQALVGRCNNVRLPF